jgi:UDP-N-acetylglucosamine acyltransferase
VSQIHPLAIVSTQAEIGRNVRIGPFCVIDEGVTIGDECTLAARASIKSGTRIGEKNEICEGAVLGGKPQHKQAGKILGELLIGSGNSIREHVTIHRGLHQGENTVVGDNNLIMVNSHIGHDCRVGNQTIIANNAMLAGHVTVEDRAYLSGAVGIHQFCRIGQYAMVGGQAHISQDVLPFVTVDGQSSTIVGLNNIGLRRAGFTDEDIRQLKEAYRIIFRSGTTWAQTLHELAATFHDGPAAQFERFLASGKRGFVRERRAPRNAFVAFTPPANENMGQTPEAIRLRSAG